jgi:hypothetical protein
VRRLNAELRFQVLGDDIAVADPPVMLKAHEADALLARERRRFRQRELALRLDQSRFEDSTHRLGIAATRGFAASFRRAERLHVNVADAGVSEARGKHVLGKAGASRIGDLAHVDQCFHFRGFQHRDEIRNTDAFVADRPIRLTADNLSPLPPELRRLQGCDSQRTA